MDCGPCDTKIFCENCCEGNLHKSPFPTFNGKRVKREFLDLIRTDVCGKIAPSSLGGANYFLTFIDEATKYTWVYFLKTKGEVFTKFKEWKVFVEKQFDRNLKIICSDIGEEYVFNIFEKYLKTEGIKHERTIIKTPEQNEVAGSKNRTFIESV